MYRLCAAMHLLWVFLRAALWQKRAAGCLPRQLSPAAMRRFYHYYQGTTYLAAVFSALSGRGRNREERRLFALMAALAAYFDDLSDARPAAPDPVDWTLRGRLLDPDGTALCLLDELRRSLGAEQAGGFESALEAVYQVEMRTTAQPDLPGLMYSTGEKGGNSVLLFRSLLHSPLSMEERELLFEFGRLIQLSDDIFDVWFDLVEPPQHTLAVWFLQKNKVGDLIQLFENQVDSLRERMLKSSFPHRKTTWATIFFLVAATRVALGHYRRLALRHGALPLHDRSQMVVDMAAWPNRWRMLVMILRKSGKSRGGL